MGVPAQAWHGILSAPLAPADGVAMEAYLDALWGALNPAVDGIDDANIKAAADIQGSKLLDGSIPAGKLGSGVVSNTEIALGTLTDDRLLWADTTGIKALRTAAAQRKVAYGRFEITTALWGTAVLYSAAITFASGDDSPANFASTTGLRVFCQIQTAEADEFVTRITALSVSGFTVEVKEASGASITPGASIFVEWMVVGRSA